MTDGDTSREATLRAVRFGKPAPVPLPEIDVVSSPSEGLVDSFASAVKAAAGSVQFVAPSGVEDAVASLHPHARLIASPVKGTPFKRLADIEPASVDVLVCRGEFGVAENGAVWVPESSMGVRAAPFLAQHLVIVLSRDAIVSDMHAACRRLGAAVEGFGAFIAGASKTADIGQSLVIGAHGPRSLTVLLEGWDEDAHD